MLTPDEQRIVYKFKSGLRDLSPIKRLVVFGSRARGEAAEDSDFDIFIELSDLTPQMRRKISDLAWEVGFDEGVVISTFVVTSQALTDSLLAANPILKAIQSEGIAL